MARETSDREDLLREATALVERVELAVAGVADPVVAGFRRDGGVSLFFGAELVLQFNSRGELRRGFCDGKLLKAEQGKLVELRRERTAEEVNLVSRSLSADETAAFLAMAGERLKALTIAIGTSQASVLRQHPPDAAVLDRLSGWLNSLPSAIAIADRPNVG